MHLHFFPGEKLFHKNETWVGVVALVMNEKLLPIMIRNLDRI